ncbi:MAG: glycosyltransferase [Porphyromonas sp.]|nr:glycosyltransferase [Porphyromonas sp.]
MDYTGLKVAFLHPRLEGGGAERVSLTTAKLFASWGIKSYFIGAQHNREQFIVPESLGATIHRLPEEQSFYTECNKEALRRYIDEEGISIAFVCYLKGDFFRDRLGTQACKFVYWNHGSPYWEHAYRVEAGARYSIRKWFEWHIKGEKRRAKGEEALAIVREQYRRDVEIFDSYIVLCPEYKKELSEDLSLSEELGRRIIPMFNTIAIEQHPQLEKKKEIAMVGRVEMVQKRFDRMLYIWKEVMYRLPDWTLRIYGGGHDVWLMHKLVKKLKLERVEYCGYVTDLSKIYNDSAVVCLTSTSESWGMVLVEAQNNGCIPMAFDCSSGVSRVLRGGAGALLPSYDMSRYAEQLYELCSNDQLRESMQKRCLEKRLEYHPNVNDETWDSLFETLLR